jgi:sugar lactone lactonase YvrE
VKLDVDNTGTLSNLRYFVEKGEFSSVPDTRGNVCIADGDVYMYGPDGKLIRRIPVPERPSTLVFGGKEGKMLYITGRSALYRILL